MLLCNIQKTLYLFISKTMCLLMVTGIFLCSPVSVLNCLVPAQAVAQLPIIDKIQNISTTPIKLTDLHNTHRFLAQNVDTTHSTAQSINSGQIHGRVLELLTNQPLLNARIVLAKVDEEHKRYHTASASNGLYSFNNIEPGHYVVT